MSRPSDENLAFKTGTRRDNGVPSLPLAGGEEPGAGLSVPGAVGVSGQAALGAVGPV